MKVLSDILSAVDRGDTVILASAAFDTVDHGILLERLYTSYGVRGQAHDWFRTFDPTRLAEDNTSAATAPNTPLSLSVAVCHRGQSLV